MIARKKIVVRMWQGSTYVLPKKDPLIHHMSGNLLLRFSPVVVIPEEEIIIVFGERCKQGGQNNENEMTITLFLFLELFHSFFSVYLQLSSL